MSALPSPRLLNEFVCISRLPDMTFAVTCGSRRDETQRFVFAGFADMEAAIAWVDELDRRAAQAANVNRAPAATTDRRAEARSRIVFPQAATA